MSRRGLHHLDLVVSSLERSLPLYRELLQPLGYTEAYEVVGERGEPVWYLVPDGVVQYIEKRGLYREGQRRGDAARTPDTDLQEVPR